MPASVENLKTMTIARDGRVARMPLVRPERGFRQAVRERDEPFGDLGPTTSKG